MLLACICILRTAQAQEGVQRPEEMEFDARVIQGQRAEGAVYLFQRAARPLPPLLKYRRDYLGTVIIPVFGRETELGQAALKRLGQAGAEVKVEATSEIASPEAPKKQVDEKTQTLKTKPTRRALTPARRVQSNQKKGMQLKGKRR